MEDSKYAKIAHVSRNHLGHSRLLTTYRSLDTRLALHETAERAGKGTSQNDIQNKGVDIYCAILNTAMDRGLSIIGLRERVLALVEQAADQMQQEAAEAAKAVKPAPKAKAPKKAEATTPEPVNTKSRRATKAAK